MARAIGPVLALALGLAALGGCAPRPKPFAELPRMGVEARLDAGNLCSLGVSPALRISNVPRRVKAYTVRMTNLDVLFQTPWQATVAATGAEIPAGAATPYEGPCPGQNQRFNYRIEVLALGDGQRPLAYGQTLSVVLSTDRMVRASGSAVRAVPAPSPTPAVPADPMKALDEASPPDDVLQLPYTERGLNPELVPTYPR